MRIIFYLSDVLHVDRKLVALETGFDCVFDVLYHVDEDTLFYLVENVVTLLEGRVTLDVEEPGLQLRVYHELKREQLKGAALESSHLELIDYTQQHDDDPLTDFVPEPIHAILAKLPLRLQ